MLKAKLKQQLRARLKTQEHKSYEISDDECVDASPLAATVPPAVLPPASSEPQVSTDDSCSQPLLTRSAQLELAHSKKKPRKQPQRQCLSKCSLAIARKRSKANLQSKKRKAQASNAATIKKAGGKGKTKATPKALPKLSPKAKAKSKAAGRCKAKAKAKPSRTMGLPGDAEIRSYHGLMKKFRQSREGDIFGEVVKDQRPVLREKIHVSKKFLCLLLRFWLVHV